MSTDLKEKWLLYQLKRKNDPELFGKLYDMYAPRLYRFVYFKTHHTEIAQDLTSQIFMKTLERIRSYDARKGSFRSWLYRLARNAVIDHYRTERRTVQIEDVWDIKDHRPVSPTLEDELLLKEVGSLMTGLTSIERDVLVLRIWQGLPHRDIAMIIGKNETNCKKIYSRAIQKLKNIIPHTLHI